MKIIFMCNYCHSEFEPKYDLLVYSYCCCPYCACTDTRLTEHSKLMLNRKEKLIKLNDSTRGINT